MGRTGSPGGTSRATTFFVIAVTKSFLTLLVLVPESTVLDNVPEESLELVMVGLGGLKASGW